VFHKGDQGSKFYIVLEGHCSVLLPVSESEGEVEVCEYGRGDSFGELALMTNQVRAASILCKTDIHFAVLERNDFVRIVGKVKEFLLNQKVDFLKKFPIFTQWTRTAMQKVTYHFREKMYKRKQAAFVIGDEANYLFFIKEGEFQVLETISHSKSHLNRLQTSSQTVEMTLLSSFQIFGEEDILAGHKTRTYTIVCHSTSAQVLHVSREVRSRQDFLKRVCTEDSLGYLRKMTEQKQNFRRKRLETMSQVGNFMSAIEKQNREVSPHHHKFASFPGAKGLLPETVELLEADLKKCSVSHICEDPRWVSPDRSPWIRTYSSLEEWSPVPFEGKFAHAGHMTWDKILNHQQSPKTRKNSDPRQVRNIHTQAHRKHNPFHPLMSPKPHYKSPWPLEASGLRLVALTPTNL